MSRESHAIRNGPPVAKVPRTSGREGPVALAAADAAKLLGISLSHFYQLQKTARLPVAVRLGRSARWIRAELEAWLEAGAPTRRRWEAMKAHVGK
jgi:excisionase family DNA binding protein